MGRIGGLVNSSGGERVVGGREGKTAGGERMDGALRRKSCRAAEWWIDRPLEGGRGKGVTDWWACPKTDGPASGRTDGRTGGRTKDR